MGELDEEEKDEELEKKDTENRLRKREDVKVVVKVKGLTSSVGWKDRSDAARGEERWKRTVEKEVGGEKSKSIEKIPLLEQYELGLDRRGMEINSFPRKNSQFGSNRRALLLKENGGKGEKRNWTANFTREGCVGSKDADGNNWNNCHNGRSGEPIIMIIGDEATPPVVGYIKVGEGNMCSWVFRKEHLALQEVVGILKRLDEEKREWDKDSGRRPHDMFIPNGRKILVDSYVHLRREGQEGYISDFNIMVKDIWAITKDFGIEVLPCVHMIYEGIDVMGGKLPAVVRKWLKWMAEQKGRESIGKLGRTGGEEVSWGRTSRIIYRPSFMSVSRKQVEGEKRVRWQNRGNRIDIVRGERKEVELKHLMPAASIGNMLKGKEKVEEED